MTGSMGASRRVLGAFSLLGLLTTRWVGEEDVSAQTKQRSRGETITMHRCFRESKLSFLCTLAPIFIEISRLPLTHQSVNSDRPDKRHIIFYAHSFHILYRARLKGAPAPRFGEYLFLLLITTFFWPCLQHSTNLGPTF